MKSQTKMKAINLLTAKQKIEKIVLKYAKLYSVYIGIRWDINNACYSLYSDVFYNEKGDNFGAVVYDFRAELTLENLLLEVEKECQKRFVETAK